jgi:hypothetical protein
MSAASFATSVALSTEIPTSAFRSAGASLILSPPVKVSLFAIRC